MRRRDTLVLLAMSASSGLLVACGQANGDGKSSLGGRTWPPFRYRLTVEVETPQGLRTGSSTIQVRKSEASRISIPSPGAVSTKISGEAVAVDLPNGRTLFALLRSDDDTDWAGRALYYVIEQQTTDERVASPDDFATDMNRVLALRGIHALPRRYRPGGSALNERSGYPMLVTFGNIADPKTVAKVDPDDLAATFGKGVKLKRITVARDDAVTTGIEKRFRWWNEYKNRHFDGSSTNSEDLTTSSMAAHLSSGSFSTEFNK